MIFKEYLPLFPWEGLPVPRKMVVDKPATIAQKRYIARLCHELNIPDPLENFVTTQGEAGRLIRELKEELRWRKKRKKK